MIGLEVIENIDRDLNAVYTEFGVSAVKITEALITKEVVHY